MKYGFTTENEKLVIFLKHWIYCPTAIIIQISVKSLNILYRFQLFKRSLFIIQNISSSCTNAKKWEIELATLKSNNIRLTSALQESTANVDEWKRQLHTYKEENLRLKRDIDSIKPNAAGAAAAGNVSAEGAEEARREIAMLKNRVQTLEKELMNAEIELRAANKALKDKSMENNVRKWDHKFYFTLESYSYFDILG